MAITKATAKPVTAPKPSSTATKAPTSTTAKKTSTGSSTTSPISRINTDAIRRAISQKMNQGLIPNLNLPAQEQAKIKDFSKAKAAEASKTPAESVGSKVALTKGVNSATAASGPSAAAATDAPKQVGPVDLSKMSMEEQYDYLQNTAIKQAGGNDKAWKTGDGELNLVGIRSFQDGKAVAAEGDKYNDTIYACRMKDGKKEVYAFDGTTDAGKWDDAKGKGMSLVDDFGRDRGVTHLADGFYKESFGVGKVSGGEQGLEQKGWVRLHGDANNDGKIQQNEKLGRGDKGYLAGADWQIQFHRGGAGDTVGETSAGCQTIKADQYDKFMGLVNEAPNKDKLSYCLTDSSKLEQPGFDVGEKKPWYQLDITQRQSQNQGSGMLAGFLGALNPDAKGRGVINDEAGGSVADKDKDITFDDQLQHSDRSKTEHSFTFRLPFGGRQHTIKFSKLPDGHGIIVTPYSGKSGRPVFGLRWP